jgi:prepilin-type N-terminal cleavage/methylation domain-containing protein
MYTLARNTKLRYSIAGFTLIELIVVMSIIVVLTSAVLPTIGTFNKDQNLHQATENFAANVRLAREKSYSGVVIDPQNAATRVWWGVNCNSGALTQYQLGYTGLDSSGNPQGTFQTVTTETLSKDPAVRLSSCAGFPIYFKRIAGTAPTLIGGDPIVITIASGTSSKTVQVYKSGNIVTN